MIRRMITRLRKDPTIRARIGRLHFEAGWYSGEHLRLLQLILLEQMPDDAPLIIINLIVAKLGIELDLEPKP